MKKHDVLRRDAFLKSIDAKVHEHKLNNHLIICLSIQNSHLFFDWYGTKGSIELYKAFCDVLDDFCEKHNAIYSWFNNANYYLFVEKDSFKQEEFYKNIQEAIYHIENIAPFRVILGIYPIANNTVLIAENMCNKAKLACITAGRNDEGIHIFQNDAIAFLKERISYEGDIQRAMNNDEFIFFLMPKYNSINNKIIGAEALIRWNNPKAGIIPPYIFMPALENENLIAKLDYYIWEKVCQTLHRWKSEGRIVVPIAINVSVVDIQTIDVAKTLLDLIHKYEIEPTWIRVEITETAVAKNLDYVIDLINRLHDEKIEIEMDDFGSGFSSLNMLKEIPIDAIKLDMNILDFNKSNESKAKLITQSVIQMAHSLNLPITVEGVETIDQIRFLHSLDCIYVQGFYYYQPLPLEKFEELMDSKNISSSFDLHEEYKKWIHHDLNYSSSNLDLGDILQAFNIATNYMTGSGLLNLENGEYLIIKGNNKLPNLQAGSKIQWSEYIEELYDKNIVHDNTKAIFKQKTDIERLKKILYYSKNPEVFRCYKNIDGIYKWVLIKIIPCRNCSPSNPYCNLVETEYIKINPNQDISDYYYTIDTLTKTFNRNKYSIDIDNFQYAWMKKIVVAYVDVVGLHEINNHLGHQRGDEMLAEIANEAQNKFMESFIYRIGGDEFVILSPDVDQKDVELKINELKEILEKKDYYISVGLAETDNLDELKDTINIAEKRMRQEKQAFYETDDTHRQQRNLNQKLEEIIIKNDQMESVFNSIKDEYEGFFISDFEKDTITPVYATDEIKQMIDNHYGKTYQAMSYFINNSIANESVTDLKKYLDPSYLSLYLAKHDKLTVDYKRKDGHTIILTIIKNIRKPNEYIWIFRKNNQAL